MDFINIILALLAVFVVLVVMVKMFGSSRGAQPLTDAGPKPRFKTPLRPRIKVRPTSRRMRSGGTAYMLRRNEYATDLLFLIALDAALDYDEMHYGLYDFIDSPFMDDTFDYSGSDFEDYAETDAVTEGPLVGLSINEAPEATAFEELSTEDDSTKYSVGDGGSDYDSGDSYDSDDSYDSGGGDDW